MTGAGSAGLPAVHCNETSVPLAVMSKTCTLGIWRRQQPCLVSLFDQARWVRWHLNYLDKPLSISQHGAAFTFEAIACAWRRSNGSANPAAEACLTG